MDLEQVCIDIHAQGDALGADEWQKRRMVAHAFGYEDARFMVYMHETHGFSVIDSSIWAVRQGLKVPHKMLRHELLCIGKKESSVDSLLREISLMTGRFDA